MTGSRSPEDLRRSAGSPRSLSQRVRSTSSPEALERTRRNAASKTRRPAATIDHGDILQRYRSGDTVGKRMGSLQGDNGHASKLPMLSRTRTKSATPTSASPTSNAARIAALRRQTAARTDAARTKAARASAGSDLTEARIRSAREGAAADTTAKRVKAAREKNARSASDDARIKNARSKYNARVKNARGDRAPGAGQKNGGGGAAPIGIRPDSTTNGAVNGSNGIWGTGHDNYYSDPYGYYNHHYWHTWGGHYGHPWGGWFGGPFYAVGFWWHSYWNWGGAWRYPFYYYGPFIPAGYSVVVYEEAEAPYEEPLEEEFIEQEEDLAPATGALAPEQTDAGLQRELNRAAAYYLTQGDRAFRETRYGDAAHFYAKAVEFAPESGILYLVLSDALFATGDYRYAAYALRQALAKEPSLASNVVDKRDFYSDPSDFDRQLATLERFVEDHVLDTDARLVLSANYLFGRRADNAIAVIEDPFSEELRTSKEGQVLLRAALDTGNSMPAQIQGPQEF